MGEFVSTREAFTGASAKHVPREGPATAAAEQHARETGNLNPLVDPKGFGVIRESRARMEKQPNGLWKMLVGPAIPCETRLDTTGSMGGNVDVALKVLADTYGLCSRVLPGYDLHVAIGIFGDVSDNFVLCRPQFEMLADKIVHQLTLMVPERQGGDTPEDPHYGIFGGAFLTAAYINKIGLKGYDFTVSDAPARDRLDERTLVRIYGDEVFDKVAENGHQLNRKDLPTTKEVVRDLLKISHAFFLQVGEGNSTTRFWADVYGKNRVVVLPSTELLAQVQATIIGLTEGTISLQNVEKFLKENNVSSRDATEIIRSVANIPIGAQAILPNFGRRPKKGDLFKNKMDAFPVSDGDVEAVKAAKKPTGEKKKPGGWL